MMIPRQSRCLCGELKPSSDIRLAFFEYRGAGSPYAEDLCRCGFNRSAHNNPTIRPNPRICASFEARGPHEFDSHYCGCRGWD